MRFSELLSKTSGKKYLVTLNFWKKSLLVFLISRIGILKINAINAFELFLLTNLESSENLRKF